MVKKRNSKNMLANSLIALRKQEGISQQQFADKVGITRSMVAGYEACIHEPSLDILLKISEVCNVSTDNLLKGNLERMDDNG